MVVLVTLTISRFGGSGGQIGASITPSGGGGGTPSTTLKHETGNARDTDSSAGPEGGKLGTDANQTIYLGLKRKDLSVVCPSADRIPLG